MNKEKEWEITLNYTGRYFSRDNFICDEVNGEYTAIFKYGSEDLWQRSVDYCVMNMDKTSAVAVYTEGRVLTGQHYIVAEKGAAGLNFEVKAFICTVTAGNDGFVIDIAEVRDETLCAELWDTAERVKCFKRHKFNEGLMNETLPCARDEAGLKKILEKYSGTRFLDIDPRDDTYQYLPSVQSGKSYLGYRSLPFVKRYAETLSSGGLPVSCPAETLADRRLEDIGVMLFKDEADSKIFTVVKPVEWLHDMACGMWLKARVQYRYPQNADGIARDYPQLYRGLTQEPEYWRDIKPVEEAPPAACLGDEEILIPAEFRASKFWGVRKDPFQFAIGRCLRPDFGPYVNYFICDEGDYAACLVNCNGGEYIAVYQSAGMERFKKDVYARLKFHKFMPVSELMTGDKPRDEDKFYGLLRYAYYFHTNRYKLVSVTVDGETFDKLYLA